MLNNFTMELLLNRILSLRNKTGTKYYLIKWTKMNGSMSCLWNIFVLQMFSSSQKLSLIFTHSDETWQDIKSKKGSNNHLQFSWYANFYVILNYKSISWRMHFPFVVCYSTIWNIIWQTLQTIKDVKRKDDKKCPIIHKKN